MVQEVLGVQASQEGPGRRKWKKEDIRQIFSYAVQLSLQKEGQGAPRTLFKQEGLYETAWGEIEHLVTKANL